jgi:hypothetical protein
MSKGEILQFCKDYSGISLNDDTLTVYYDDTLNEIGFFNNPPLVDVEFFAIIAGTAEYEYPDRAVRHLDIFHDDKLLSPARLHDLEAYDMDWRTLSGTPAAYTFDEQNARTFKLIPNPDTTSDALIFLTGSPCGS